MMIQKLVLLVVCYVIFSPIDSFAQTKITVGSISGDSNFLKTNDAKIHYEVFGSGDPLLILHGNGGSTESVHALLPELFKEYQVILMDSRCHGKSSCPENELNYLKMASDVNALLMALNLNNVTLWGHSDGGIIGLIMGYKYPNRIKKMLISGANTRPDSTALENKIVEFIQRFDEIPDPMMKKQIKLMAFHPNISMEDIKKINVPIVLMVGDRDAVKMTHTLEIFKALPKANLCVLPGTSHFLENKNHIIYWLKDLKNPFYSPSTVEIAVEMGKQIYGDNNK